MPAPGPNSCGTGLKSISGDLREGGRYRLEQSGVTGVIEQCNRPARLAVTWEYSGDSSGVELAMSEAKGGTVLRLEHRVSDDDHWRTYGPGATGVGWESSLLALALHLAGDPRAEPEEMEKLRITPDGTEFVRRSACGWAEAHAAAGADREQARAASERTFAFYTGVEQVK